DRLPGTNHKGNQGIIALTCFPLFLFARLADSMPGFAAERRFHAKGWLHVAGLDEVGRGAWAGPLVAGAVILPPPSPSLRKALRHVNDSKLLPRKRREECAVSIRA